jgi:hypothetical protein
LLASFGVLADDVPCPLAGGSNKNDRGTGISGILAIRGALVLDFSFSVLEEKGNCGACRKDFALRECSLSSVYFVVSSIGM